MPLLDDCIAAAVDVVCENDDQSDLPVENESEPFYGPYADIWPTIS